MNRAGHCWRCEAPCIESCARCRLAFYCSKECQKQDKWRHEPHCDDAVLKKKCLGCSVEQEGITKCSNCSEAFYCSEECQRKHWRQHKSSCKDTVERTIELADKIREHREMKLKTPGMSATYYWGNVPAVDLINLSMNEGEEYCNPLALLLCGVGDPRNVLLTISSLPDVYKQQVTFVLNDICPCTLARTVLLLYMLNKGGNHVTESDVVIRIWYSLYITENDFTFLMIALQELVATTELHNLTEGIMKISADQLSQLQDVWKTWIRLAQRKGSHWLEEQRHEVNSSDPDRDIGMKRYIETIPKEHRISVQRFFKTGIFASTAIDTKDLTQQNVTLTGRGFHVPCSWKCYEAYYSLPGDALPFTGWDYSAVKNISHDDSLPEMYSIYLSHILQKSVEKLRRNKAKFHYILADFLNIEAISPVDLRYDRITTSNLWDYCPLPVLLTKFKGFLNSANPHAVMLTMTQNWAGDANFQHIIHPVCISNKRDLTDLKRRASKDTQNPELVQLTGMSALIEYLNTTREFNMFLRASLLTSFSQDELVSFKTKKKLPSVKSLVKSLGLHLRDFIRNENTVFPFRWALNCRRATMLRGYERALEWKLPSAAENNDSAKELVKTKG